MALHRHRAWFEKSSMKAVKLMPWPCKKWRMGLTMYVSILGEHLSPNGKTCHLESFLFHLNLRNFLTLECTGTWRKASFRSNPAHHAFFWNHFLTAFMSSIWKKTCLIDLLNRFRFRMGLHLSGDL